MVRPNAAILGCVLAGVLITGCSKPRPEPVSQADAKAAVELQPSPERASTYQRQPYRPARAPIAAAPRPRSRSAAPRIHVVQSKDTLYLLAERYYNNGQDWPRIYEANRAVISNPDRLQVGMKLVVP